MFLVAELLEVLGRVLEGLGGFAYVGVQALDIGVGGLLVEGDAELNLARRHYPASALTLWAVHVTRTVELGARYLCFLDHPSRRLRLRR